MKTFLSVAIGGSIGALCRFGLSKLINNHSVFNTPTFVINTSGCFFLGIIAGYSLSRNINNWIIDGIVIGFLGAYTTYSAFTMEGFKIIQNSGTISAFIVISINLLAGLVFLFAGTMVGKLA